MAPRPAFAGNRRTRWDHGSSLLTVSAAGSPLRRTGRLRP